MATSLGELPTNDLRDIQGCTSQERMLLPTRVCDAEVQHAFLSRSDPRYPISTYLRSYAPDTHMLLTTPDTPMLRP
eukprot:488319-Rhodomonas_salina.5